MDVTAWILRPRAPYAADPTRGRGRLIPEPASPTRTDFQRDRDRVLHSSAFRRLKHKTQVFVYHEGDHYRTRLTHTLEVAQIARSIARALGLDEDLAETVALSHDLGHTPFGHAGERALDACMAGFGGFDHNAQSLRVLTRLERRYADYDGLNLTFESLEGVVKHNGPLLGLDGEAAGSYAGKTLPVAILEYGARHDLGLHTHASAEAQAAAIADDIAYDAHDVDDGLRAGLFALDDLAEAPLLADILSEVRARHPGLDEARTVHEVVRRVITRLVEDAIAESARRLEALARVSVDAVRDAGHAVVAFSPAMTQAEREVKRFLTRRMYRHPWVDGVMADARRVLDDLFGAYAADLAALPGEWAREVSSLDAPRRMRAIADFIAGMTDRYALDEHRRLFDATPDLR
ncbi:deoxyguanosinetriphosphate triphosphohydrolase-like protein [Methylopila jiangsuensis]|uniref:Deoxyguanosinetriphosphate triphosphohydrolase-like protein n=1 Tax=Methylopila jiangsuensis TaxID=586230 RepID=A0A9W6JF45_9HYPH|nr:deoxyguanosinetriphosphate triphosphohydrolase [Methylopila jiangsuensis]MDR6286104.1 dGTPase [Methylopila jiangsuensis]GLK75862.1 deoxyguanosinetriphosphate triphosphohydrolase-like protein [Methylopila jiangsuensis]